MTVKKARQNVTNTSAQVSNANATFTVESPPGLVSGSGQPAPEAGRQQTAPPESSETGDQEEAASEGTSLNLAGLPPIYLALAISINLAADYQNSNSNRVERS